MPRYGRHFGAQTRRSQATRRTISRSLVGAALAAAVLCLTIVIGATSALVRSAHENERLWSERKAFLESKVLVADER